MILTAEADSLPTDEKELLEDCGLVGCHSNKSNDLSVHAGINSPFMGIAARESRERSAEQLFVDLESVASAVEGSDLRPTQDPF